jgi:hypothetical protein
MTCNPTQTCWAMGIGVALGVALGAALGSVGAGIAIGAAVALLPCCAVQRKHEAPK